MNWLFTPAFAILGRMRYAHKFLLTGAVLCLPMLYLLAVALAPLAQSLRQDQRMSLGAGYVQAMQPLLLALQKHRGQSNALLAGDASAVPRVEQAARQTVQAFQEIRARIGQDGDALALSARVQALQAQWDGLAGRAARMPAQESFTAHTALIAEVLALLTQAADSAALSTEADAGIYYLQDALAAQAPPLVEALARARGLTAGVLARGGIGEQEKTDIALLMGRVQVHLERMQADLGKAIAAQPHLAAALEPRLETLASTVQDFQDSTAAHALHERYTQDSAAYFAAATRPIDQAAALSDAATEALDRLLQARRAHSLRALWLTGAGVLVLVALALYLTLAMQTAITRDVGRIELAASALARGDLGHRMEMASRDEMGRIAAAFECARQAIAGLIHSASGAAGHVADTAREVADNAGCCSGAADRQSESVSASAAAVQQMAVSAAHIADQTREAHAIAQEAGRLSVKGQTAIAAASHDMHTVAASVQQAARQIEGLHARATTISDIVQVIRDIADQTNLLALNAAIEAARAGELGRGFAVVADEVRKLAERTAKATTEISGMIDAVQSESADAVTRMEVSRKQAMDGVVTVESATQALEDIRQAISGVLQRVAEIASASSQQRAASTGIARNVEHIAQMTESNSATAAQVSHQATRMGELVRGLAAELGRFNLLPAQAGPSGAPQAGHPAPRTARQPPLLAWASSQA